MTNSINVVELAEIAYNAYGENRNWKTFDGRDMPAWNDISDVIQIAWIAAAIAVRQALLADEPKEG